MNMVPDINESGSFMKKVLKILLYALCMILTAAYIGGMAFLLNEKNVYGAIMAVIAILVIACAMATDKGGDVE